MTEGLNAAEIVVVGAGAMGTAVACALARGGAPVTILGTRFDDAVIDALTAREPHPGLGVGLVEGIELRRHDGSAEVLEAAETFVLGVSSAGLGPVVAEVKSQVKGDRRWLVATKGWDASSLKSPSELIDSPEVVILAGPALAKELAVGAPTGMVCASGSGSAVEAAATLLRAGGVTVTQTDDVVGVETAAAYKNVTAIAVGMCEGLGATADHPFANARAAMFARGIADMSALAASRGGRPQTIAGLAGVGDLYVTCLGGRNGAFGRNLGQGMSATEAEAAIGSTVEGVENTAAALAIAGSVGVDLPTARAVQRVLAGEASALTAITDALSS